MHPQMVKFVESRPFANPESAVRKLVEIARDLTCAQGWAYTGVTNTAFLRAGGHRPFILPMSVKSGKFTIFGIPTSDGKSAYGGSKSERRAAFSR